MEGDFNPDLPTNHEASGAQSVWGTANERESEDVWFEFFF